MARMILQALDRHGSLTVEQLTAHVDAKPYAVVALLRELRQQGLVDAAPAGEVEGHANEAATEWRLTDEGRAYVRRSG